MKWDAAEVTIAEELDGKVELYIVRTGNMNTTVKGKATITGHTAKPSYEGEPFDFDMHDAEEEFIFDINSDRYVYGFEVVDDSLAEEDEYFDVQISDVTGGIAGSPSKIRVWITSAEKPAAASPTPSNPGASPTPDASATPTPDSSATPTPSEGVPSPDASTQPTETPGTQPTAKPTGSEFALLSAIGIALASIVAIKIKKQ